MNALPSCALLSSQKNTKNSRRLVFLATATLLLSACGSAPKQADWQINTVSAMEQAQTAYLNAEQSAAATELQKARGQTARAADPQALAQIELRQCALQVASLDWQPCRAYEALRAYSTLAQQAYADYLYAHVEPAQIHALPAQQQSIAQASTQQQAQAALEQIQAPLSKLVAAAVTLRRAGAPNQALLETAVNVSSEQGWRRPLLAWLKLQENWAQQQNLEGLQKTSAMRIQLLESHGNLQDDARP